MLQPLALVPSLPAFSPVVTTLDLPVQAGIITALAWSEDATHLAAVSSTGLLLIWHASSGTRVLSHRVARTRLTAVAWSRHGKSLLLGSARGSLSVFHLSSQTLVYSSTFPAVVAQIALSPHAIETHFLVRTGSSLHLFTQGRPQPRTLRYPTTLVDSCWSPDGQSFALVCANGLVQVCDASTRRVRWQQTTFPSQALRVTWDAAGKRLAVGMANGAVQIHRLCGEGDDQPVSLSRFPIQVLGWGERYLVAGSERDVTFWRDDTSAPHCQPTRSLPALTFDAQGTHLATAWPHAIALATLL